MSATSDDATKISNSDESIVPEDRAKLVIFGISPLIGYSFQNEKCEFTFCRLKQRLGS